jgi:hypothetical protein
MLSCMRHCFISVITWTNEHRNCRAPNAPRFLAASAQFSGYRFQADSGVFRGKIGLIVKNVKKNGNSSAFSPVIYGKMACHYY